MVEALPALILPRASVHISYAYLSTSKLCTNLRLNSRLLIFKFLFHLAKGFIVLNHPVKSVDIFLIAICFRIHLFQCFKIRLSSIWFRRNLRNNVVFPEVLFRLYQLVNEVIISLYLVPVKALLQN